MVRRGYDLDMATQAPITMYVTRWCGDCRMAKRVLDGHGIAYDAIDIADDDDARDFVVRVNGGYKSVPTIVLPSQRILVEPSRWELESALRSEGLVEARPG